MRHRQKVSVKACSPDPTSVKESAYSPPLFFFLGMLFLSGQSPVLAGEGQTDQGRLTRSQPEAPRAASDSLGQGRGPQEISLCYSLTGPALTFEGSPHPPALSVWAERHLRQKLAIRGILCPQSIAGRTLALRVQESFATPSLRAERSSSARLSARWSVHQKNPAMVGPLLTQSVQLSAIQPWTSIGAGSTGMLYEQVHQQLDATLIDTLLQLLSRDLLSSIQDTHPMEITP